MAKGKSAKNGNNREYKRDEKGRFVKGTAPGPGRKRRDFFTDLREAAKELAKQLKLKNEEEIFKKLIMKGLAEGLKGNYNFWRDLAERIYGKEAEKMDLNLSGKPLLDVLHNDSDKKNSKTSKKD